MYSEVWKKSQQCKLVITTSSSNLNLNTFCHQLFFPLVFLIVVNWLFSDKLGFLQFPVTNVNTVEKL